MNLSENVAKLQTLLSSLKYSDAKFAADLIASYKKYGNLTPKQAPWIEKLIERASPKASAPVSAPAPSVVNVGGFAGVVALFTKAHEHLKFPKIRLVVGGVKVVLSLNGPKSKAPGAVSVTSEGAYGQRSYYGRVAVDGTFTPAHAAYGDFLTALTGILTDLSLNPARVAKEHGKLTGNCCFCGKVLGLGKEKRSVLVGFGPDCAEHYGLKGEWLAAADKAEAKASVTAIAEPATAIAVPTLTVSPAAQTIIDGLAESLAKATGAVSVTVSDGETVVDSYGENPGDLGDYVEQTHPEFAAAFQAAESTECALCGVPSTDVKILHEHPVCVNCCTQLQ